VKQAKRGKTSFIDAIKTSIEIILREQHSVTGLFPAATKKCHVGKNHYAHAWVRDSSMIAATFFDPFLLSIQDSNSRKSIIASGTSFVYGMLDISASEPWREAFAQGIDTKKDGYGRQYTTLTKEAPPIHLRMDGNQCAWPTQNQPDSWGEFLISLGLGLKQGLFIVDVKQKNTIESIAKYLLKIRVRDLEQSSMWEWGQVRHPAPISSVAIVAKGFDMIMPHSSSELKESLGQEIGNSKQFIETRYPADYTVSCDHRSRTDLATFVAHGLGALEEFSLERLLEEADMELGNGQHPGKKRYIGDHYYRGDEEAIWPMGTLIEAKIFLERSIKSFKNGNYNEGKKLQLRGVTCLKIITGLQSQYGYLPELFEQRDGKLIPNGNHLLWNEALLIQVCARAEIASRLNSEELK
jgi:hypothetical protein